ncbi:MAG: GNAT family N-acetyltransferase [Candidatus Hodarchaeota archaeon]
MKFREARVSDAVGLAKVHVDTWRTAYKGIISDDFLQSFDYKGRESRWRERLEVQDEKRFFYVVEDRIRKIIGFAVGGLEQFEPNIEDPITSKYNGELLAIYVLEEHQRKGIGSKLVQKVVKSLLKHEINNMLVWVLKESKYRAFYEKLGGKYLTEKYKEIGRDKYKIVSYGWDNIQEITKSF